MKETLEELAFKEGLFRASQNNSNQASAGYNAKWFKRGAIFGAEWQKQQQQQELNKEMLEMLKEVKNRVKEFISESRQLRNTQLTAKEFVNQESYNKYVDTINLYTSEDKHFLNRIEQLITKVEDNV